MSKPIGKHADGSNCYTKGCSRNVTVATTPWDDYAKNRESSQKPSLPPVVVPDSLMREPHLGSISSTEFEGSSATSYYPVIYSYDEYTQEYSSYEDPDPEPYMVYEGLKIESINVKPLLAAAHFCKEEELPEELISKVEGSGLLSIPEWEIYGEDDYYAQRVKVDAPDKLTELLKAEYWKQPGAVDNQGILKYCRGKGLDTTGKTPLEALKEQLAQEKMGEDLSLVQKATKLKVASVRLSKLTITRPEYLKTVEPVKAEPIVKYDNPVLGVVVKDGDKTYLVDGYRRYKESILRRGRSGQFIVLSV